MILNVLDHNYAFCSRVFVVVVEFSSLRFLYISKFLKCKQNKKKYFKKSTGKN